MKYTTSYGAMNAILDCNEMIEKLKGTNTSNIPNLDKIKIVELLTDYRDLLVAEMKATTLEAFKNI